MALSVFDLPEAKLPPGTAQLRRRRRFYRIKSVAHSTLRLWAWQEEDGTEHTWGQTIGQQLLGEGGQNFWPLITATTENHNEVLEA